MGKVSLYAHVVAYHKHIREEESFLDSLEGVLHGEVCLPYSPYGRNKLGPVGALSKAEVECL